MKKYLALVGLFVVSIGSQALAYEQSHAYDYTCTNMIDKAILVRIKAKGGKHEEKTIAPGRTGIFKFPGARCLESIAYKVDPAANKTHSLTHATVALDCKNHEFSMVYAVDNNNNIINKNGMPKIDFKKRPVHVRGASGTLGGTPVFSYSDDGTVASEIVSGGPSEGRQGGIEGEGSGGTGQKETSDK